MNLYFQRILSTLRFSSDWKPIETNIVDTFCFSERFLKLGWKEKFIYNLTGRGGSEKYWRDEQNVEEEMQTL